LKCAALCYNNNNNNNNNTDLTIEIELTWHVKRNVIPVIKVATGTISKSRKKIPRKNTGKARSKGTTENSHTGHCTYTSKCF